MLKIVGAESARILPDPSAFSLTEAVVHSARRRTCLRCCFEGDEGLFRISGSKGKRGNICRKCDAEKRRQLRKADPERYRQRERANRMTRIDRVRIQNAAAVRRYEQRHPDRVRAHRIARRALARGEIKKPDCCEVLGCRCREIEMHHVDYRKPKDVIFVCNARGANHHERIHHERPLPLKPGAGRKYARAPRSQKTAA